MTAAQEPVQARDVEIIKLHRAICHRKGCGELSPALPTYQAANEWRQAHLDDHRTLRAAQLATMDDQGTLL